MAWCQSSSVFSCFLVSTFVLDQTLMFTMNVICNPKHWFRCCRRQIHKAKKEVTPIQQPGQLQPHESLELSARPSTKIQGHGPDSTAGRKNHPKENERTGQTITRVITSNLEPLVSEKLMHLMSIGINVGVLASVHSYYFDKDRRRASRRYFKYLNLGWLCATVFCVGYAGAVAGHLLKLSLESGLELNNETGANVCILTFMSMPIMFQTVHYVSLDPQIVFFNQSFKFFEDFVQYFDDQAKKGLELRFCERYLLIVIRAVAIDSVLFTICFALVKPELSPFCNYWPDVSYNGCPPVARMATAVIVAYVCYINSAGCLAYMSGSCPIILLLTVTKHLENMDVQKYGTRKLIGLYKQLELILESLNRANSYLLLPALENVLMAASVFGIYGLVRLKGVFGLAIAFTAAICTGCLISVFWVFAQIFTSSSKILRRWERSHHFSRRQLKPLRPLRIRLANYAYVDPGITLTLLEIIANNSIALLLTT